VNPVSTNVETGFFLLYVVLTTPFQGDSRAMRKIVQKIKSWFTKKPEPAVTAGITPVTPPKTRLRDATPTVKARTQHPPQETRRTPPRPRREQKRTHKETQPQKPAPAWDAGQFSPPALKEKTRFHDLSLPQEILHAVFDLGFQYCTPVQAEVLPSALKGADIRGRAQTGTGKTAAFLIAVFTHFLQHPAPAPRKPGRPRTLILAPTRELVLQIEKDALGLSRYMNCRVLPVFGGMDYQKQARELEKEPVDVIVATPGRLLDYKQKGKIFLDCVEILIIDEADRMLDMGFIPDVRRIVMSTPTKDKRQTMFFTATMTPEVSRLADSWTRGSVVVDIEPEKATVDEIDQIVYIASNEQKLTLLYNLITTQHLERVMVFCNRKDDTGALYRTLTSHGISCGLLTGDVDQRVRVKTLEAFRAGTTRVLVATDVASRGLHIEGVSHVVNYNLPFDPEDYVHRIGRTGRAGATGTSISFATEDDSYEIPKIEIVLGNAIKCVHPEEALLTPLPPPQKPREQAPASERRRRPNPPGRSGPSRGRPHGRRGPS
jgi:ATP-dependent RNA helicase RhlB